MSLSRQERRKLRVIEQALRTTDPALATLLTHPRGPGSRWSTAQLTRTLTWILMVSSLVMLTCGLILADASLLGAAVLILVISALSISVVSSMQYHQT